MRSPLLAAAVCAALVSSTNAQVSSSRPSVKNPVKPTATATRSVNLPPPAPLVGGSDDCSTAGASNAFPGPGTYAIDTAVATNGAPAGSCGLIGSDVWFYYTASQNSNATVSNGGGIGGDSVIAIWNDGSPAGTCPTTQVLCLDDS